MLIFDNASLLSLTQSSEYLGNAFLYRNTRSFSIEGFFYIPTGSQGVSGMWSKIDQFSLGNKDFQGQITINGKDFGEGKVISIDFQESNDVRVKKYTAEIETYIEGSLDSLAGGYYQGISTTNWRLIPSISESFSTSRNEDSSKSYTHSVKVQFEDTDGVNKAIEDAKEVAKNLIESFSTEMGGLLSTFSGSDSRRKLYEESINLIDASYSVSQEITFSNVKAAYSINLQHSIEIGEDGITNASEKGEISLFAVGDDTQGLNAAINAEVTLSKDRCLELFTIYVTSNYADANDMRSGFITLQKEIDRFSSKASYSVTYSNDPKKKNDLHSLEYTQEINKSGGYYTVSETGKIMGFGMTFSDKWENAKSGWTDRELEIKTELISKYKANGNSFLPLKLAEKANTFSKFNGTIDYTRGYSNDPSYVLDDKIRKMDISVSDNLPTEVFSAFEVVNFREIVQRLGVNTAGERSLSMSITGKRSSSIDDCLDFAVKNVNRYIPSGEDTHISNTTYDYNPHTNQLRCNVSWVYLVNWPIDSSLIILRGNN